jgi:beta-barrel assembly-enhancing protease
MVTFFQQLAEEQGGSGGPAFLASHPDPGNRAQLVSEAISQLPKKSFTANRNEFQKVKQETAKLKPLTAEQIAAMQQEKAGRIENISTDSVMPTGSFQTLNHNAYQVAYPANWQVFGNNNSAATIAPKGGVSEQAIALGVVINGFTPQARQSLMDSASQVYDALRQANPELRATSNPRQANINGMPAVVVDLLGPSPLVSNDGRRVSERDTLVTVQRSDGSVLWMLFISPEPQYSALSPTFQRMIESLRVN